MDDDEYDDFYGGYHQRPFRKTDLLVVGLGFLTDVSRAVANNLSLLTALAGMHVNYQIEREAFREEAALEIETLTGEDNG
jgi:hypothetical protein